LVADGAQLGTLKLVRIVERDLGENWKDGALEQRSTLAFPDKHFFLLFERMPHNFLTKKVAIFFSITRFRFSNNKKFVLICRAPQKNVRKDKQRNSWKTNFLFHRGATIFSKFFSCAFGVASLVKFGSSSFPFFLSRTLFKEPKK
jgi:hypothetical protein